MKLLLERHPPGYTCVIGELSVDAIPFCHSLERLPSDSNSPDIPAGTYSVGLTISPEAKLGRLWTPSPTGILPLVCNVPDRSGIRIHAGNDADDSRGCIEVGQWNGGEFLSSSRDTLTLLMEKLLSTTDPIVLEVCDP